MTKFFRAMCIFGLCSLILAGCASSGVRLGPVGGPGGTDFDDDRELPWSTYGPATRLTAIKGEACNVVHFIQSEYLTPTGTRFEGTKHGGGGIQICFEQDELDWKLDPDEFLIGINGNAGQFIDSLNFITNKRDFSAFFGLRFGGTGGNPFSLHAPPGYKIRKFFGASGAALDSIGIITEEEPKLPKTGEAFYKLGAAGGWGGENFEDPSIADKSIRIKNVFIAESGCVTYIRFEYADAGGNIVDTREHGGFGVCPGSNIGGQPPKPPIQLANDEFIIGIRGRAGTVIDQLWFVTNRRVIGPFGSEGGKPFWLEVPPGYQVRRLFGRSGALLDAIGIIAEKP